jgi:pimeloyl-ACP methyl ester carboxylesterase
MPIVQLHYQKLGTGHPVVLLHGLFGSGDNLRHVASGLATHHAVWLPDARNHGASPHEPEMNYDLMAADLRRLVLDQGLTRASLVGHSMGGKIAMRFALCFAELVERLVVVDIAPRKYSPKHLDILHALSALNLDHFTDRLALEARLAPAIPELSVRRFLLKNIARDITGKFRWKLNLPGILQNYPKLNADVTMEGAGRFDGPSLFVRGELSDYCSLSDEPFIRTWFPAAQFATVAGARHWVHADAPEAFLKLLRGFLI